MDESAENLSRIKSNTEAGDVVFDDVVGERSGDSEVEP
jgi:hypothetical protein